MEDGTGPAERGGGRVVIQGRTGQISTEHRSTLHRRFPVLRCITILLRGGGNFSAYSTKTPTFSMSMVVVKIIW